MQMKSDILKDKTESERNEIWHIIAHRYILSFRTLVFPAHNRVVLFLFAYGVSQYCKQERVFKKRFRRMHVSAFIHGQCYIFTTDMRVFCCIALS